MNANSRATERQAGNRYGDTVDGYFSQRGGYTRYKPKTLHTPVPIMWSPRQPFYGKKVDFGDPLNNPIPELDHHRAATSSGRVVRMPLPGHIENMWSGGMVQDAAVMYVTPDPTLTAGATAAATFPESLINVGTARPQLSSFRLFQQYV